MGADSLFPSKRSLKCYSVGSAGGKSGCFFPSVICVFWRVPMSFDLSTGFEVLLSKAYAYIFCICIGGGVRMWVGL